jgi:plasmid stability protein
MPSLIISDLPQDVLAQLERTARLHHRSVQEEAIRAIEGWVFPGTAQRAFPLPEITAIDEVGIDLTPPAFEGIAVPYRVSEDAWPRPSADDFRFIREGDTDADL